MNDHQAKYLALLLKARRKQKGWSQDSVCKGICAVSYYSKIESASVIPASSVYEDFFRNLEMTLPSEDPDPQIEKIYQLMESGQTEQARASFEKRVNSRPLQTHFDLSDPCPVDELLLMLLFETAPSGELFEMENLMVCLDPEQKAICALANQKYELAASFSHAGWILWLSAFGMYQKRVSDAQVLLHLDLAYKQAAKEGYPFLMAEIAHQDAIICSNMSERDRAYASYKRAYRLYEALHDEKALDQVRYNLGCTLLEDEHFEKALCWLEKVRTCSVMDIHKQVICLEMLGRKGEALERMKLYPCADPVGWDLTMIDRIFELIHIRLTTLNWIHDKDYGHLLMEIFEKLSAMETHKGFAKFYLPWVLQYLKANGQYAKACQILEDFPGKPAFRLPEPD